MNISNHDPVDSISLGSPLDLKAVGGVQIMPKDIRKSKDDGSQMPSLIHIKVVPQSEDCA